MPVRQAAAGRQAQPPAASTCWKNARAATLQNGGTNERSNLQVQDRGKNRGWRKGSGSYNPDK